MSRVLQQDIETKTRSGIGPACWMSPESIGQQVYSKKSDVWMFGIVVYEIVSQCEPHYDKDPLEVSTLIRFENCSIELVNLKYSKLHTFFYFEYRDEGLTPEIPSNCPQKLVELMKMCWKKQPQQRPVSSLLFVFVFVCSFHTTQQLNNLICFFFD
jgi:insulin receptor